MKVYRLFISTSLLIIGVLMEGVFHSSLSPALYLVSLFVGGWEITLSGIKELRDEKHFNVDLVMILAAIGADLLGNFREGALLIFIFLLSHEMEEYTVKKSARDIDRLIQKQPQEARKMNTQGKFETVLVEQVTLGDRLLVLKGEQIPIDGKVLSSFVEVDESLINGESIPRIKKQGENVYGGTLNVGNECLIEVNQKQSETVLAKIIQLVHEAQNQQTKTQTWIQIFEDRYVKGILIGVPFLVLVFHFLLHWTWAESFYRGVNLLVVASPCALVASSTPALLSALSNGARNGTLFKGGHYLDVFAEIKGIAFDKTGTLTKGELSVTDTWWAIPEAEILPYVLGLEKKSTHPIAQALSKKWADVLALELKTEEWTAKGMQSIVDQTRYYVGKKTVAMTEPAMVKEWKTQGKTVIYVEKNQELVGAIALSDTINETARPMLDYFHAQGIETMLLTGDNEETAQSVAKKLGIKKVYAALLPEEKVAHLKDQQKRCGSNAMVGDGINDAPALATATIGIAMGEGTDVALDVADVVIMKNDLQQLVASHQLSKRMKRIVRQNIFFSMSVIGGLIILNLLQRLTIPIAVIGHEGSTILVILNGLRLLVTPTRRKELDK